jgi:2-polyprenyl-3-methyl-5-hydroxy-6-metoxy-1,4-benzoquinol methylase
MPGSSEPRPSESSETCQICSARTFSPLFKKNGFDILKCASCGIVFTRIPPGFDLLSIYDESYFQGGQADGYGDYVGTEAVLRREFKKSVSVIRQVTGHRSGLKLLELGSAYGFFLDEASKYFECVGIEVSQPAAEHSRKRGHRVIDGILTERAASQVGSVDIVALFDVVEHLADPVATFRLIDRCLNQDGVVVLTTGDIESLYARVSGRSWRLMTPPQHTFFFSPRTLTGIFEKMNYKVELVKRPWKLVPLSLAFYQLGSRLGLRFKPLEQLNLVVPVNLGDAVMVVARKQGPA